MIKQSHPLLIDPPDGYTVLIKEGYAYVPFDAEHLIWLIDQYSPRDEYRQVLWEAVRQLEGED